MLPPTGSGAGSWQQECPRGRLARSSSSSSSSSGGGGGGGGGSGGGGGGGGGEPGVVDALLAHVQPAACCSLVVDTAVTVDALRCAVRDALAEAGCAPPAQPAAHVRASLPPHRLRLCQRVASSRSGAVMRDGRRAAEYIFGAAADQSLAVQLLRVRVRLRLRLGLRVGVRVRVGVS